MRKITLQKFVCLLVLALALGCTGKGQVRPVENVAEMRGNMLEDISGSWRIDLDAFAEQWPQAAEEREILGRDEFAARYAGIGFDIDAARRVITLHDPAIVHDKTSTFTVLSPEDTRAETAEGREPEVRLKLDEPGAAKVFTFRYAGGPNQLYFWAGEVKVATFVRHEK